MKHALALAANVFLCSASTAQSVNVDFGAPTSTFGSPTNSYGAASAQVGFWNAMNPPSPSILYLLNGSMTFTKVVPYGSGFSAFEFQNPLTSGDDEALMDDGAKLAGPTSSYTVQINGLQNGAYYVYTYAMAPDALDRTVVSVLHSTTGPLACGGTWPGQHQEGITYVRHFVNVTTFDLQITVHPEFTNGFVNGYQLVKLADHITSFCFGTATNCPCGNSGGVNAGCENSFGTGGGKLTGSGLPQLSSDTVVLSATQLPPTTTALFFQGSSALNGLAFGDGLRCAGSNTLRLGTKVASGGACSYPQAGDPSVSVRGQVTSIGTRAYQLWYRNAAAFCTAATFNLTNGVSILWQ